MWSEVVMYSGWWVCQHVHVLFCAPGGRELCAPPAGGGAHRLPEERPGCPGARGPQHHGNHRQQAGSPHHGRNPQDLWCRLWVHFEHDQQGLSASLITPATRGNGTAVKLQSLTPRYFPRQDFEEFPEHRTHFFYLLQAATSQCFPAFLSIAPAQFKLILDSIIWAFKHTMRNVADTGLKWQQLIMSDREFTQIEKPRRVSEFKNCPGMITKSAPYWIWVDRGIRYDVFCKAALTNVFIPNIEEK